MMRRIPVVACALAYKRRLHGKRTLLLVLAYHAARCV